jgi:CRP-like cAMP-binding protein
MKKAPILKKRLLECIETYNDRGFKTMVAMLQNTLLFRDFKRKTLRSISYLFKSERHTKGRIILRKRERSDFSFFVKSGEIDIIVRSDIKGNEECNMHFMKINKGGYFNLSNSILKKFSLFDFEVSSDSAELLILNAADLALLSKKNEEIYIALKSHAILF